MSFTQNHKLQITFSRFFHYWRLLNASLYMTTCHPYWCFWSKLSIKRTKKHLTCARRNNVLFCVGLKINLVYTNINQHLWHVTNNRASRDVNLCIWTNKPSSFLAIGIYNRRKHLHFPLKSEVTIYNMNPRQYNYHAFFKVIASVFCDILDTINFELFD